MTPDELLARGDAPIKAAYLVSKAEAVKPLEASSEPVQPVPSKKQARKERKRRNAGELCINFAKGCCHYGDNCRFNHDVAKVLQHKLADLPGACPFTHAPPCPYGINCRWASSHPPSEGAQHLIPPKLPQSAAKPSSSPASQAAGHLQSVPNGHPQNGRPPHDAMPDDTTPDPTPHDPQASHDPAQRAQQSNGLPESQPSMLPSATSPSSVPATIPAAASSETASASSASTPTAADPTASAVNGQEASADDNHLSQRPQAPPNTGADRVDSSGSDLVWGQPIEIGAETEVLQSSNWLSRDAQSALRSRKYDFGRADNILSSLGLQVSRAQKGKGSNTKPAAPAPEAQNGLSATRDAEAMTSNEQQDPNPGEDKLEAPSSKKPRHDDQSQLPEITPAEGRPGVAIDAAGVDEGVSEGVDVPLRPQEKKKLDFQGKLYLAPLTTVGNLPFRRVCKQYGADITCGEMALATNLLQGQPSEWALLRRHPSEDFFGVQVCGGFPDALARCAQMLDEHIDVDFVDVNMGCPIDIVTNRGAGSALLNKPHRIEQIARAMGGLLRCPLTLKIRKGYSDDKDLAHALVPRLHATGHVAAVTIHGRSRQQRYSRLADWDYIERCAANCLQMPVIGNGDVVSFEDWNTRMQSGQLATGMIARGALIKPWIFTEIKEQRHWDISASERLEMLKQYVSAGLLHWGSDSRGVETVRRFLLEWMSFLHRYIPVGLLEVLPQRLNWRTPMFVGRSELETKLASPEVSDWIQLSTMLLGPPPANFSFVPKHKASAHTPVMPGNAAEQGAAEDEENG